MKNKKSIVRKIGRKILLPYINKRNYIRYRKSWEERWKWFSSLEECDYEKEICKLYYEKMNYKLNLNNPTRFTEKIQWRKLYDRNIIYSTLSDKYAVRNWVEKKIGDEYLIPLIGVWKTADDIDFSSLPKSFVLKTNNGSKANIIVHDKTRLDVSFARERLNFWLKYPATAYSLELHYLNIDPKIIAEEYIVPNQGEDIDDYKFFCFSGEPRFFWIDTDRSTGHKRNVYDMNWNLQTWTVGKKPGIETDISKPESFDRMVDIARTLSKGFAHVRVDLYYVSGKIYFGEMTFTSGGGIERFFPDEMDEKVGEMWDISTTQVDNNAVLV